MHASQVAVLATKECRTVVQMAQWRTLYTQFKCYYKTICHSHSKITVLSKHVGLQSETC